MNVNQSYSRPECQRVRDLSMEPDILVRGEEPHHFGSHNSDDIPKHGYQDQETIICQDKPYLKNGGFVSA